MADFKKITDAQVMGLLRHVEREVKKPTNENINAELTPLNFSFIQRNVSAYDYYKFRKSQLYCYNRADLKTLGSWVVTVPKDLPREYHEKFFYCTNEFLLENFGGKKNCIEAVVHFDEITPHLHYLFIPTVPDKKHGGEKICMSSVVNREVLRTFHPALESYLAERFKDDPVTPTIRTGITKLQGGNRSVLELKRQKEYEYQQTYTIEGSDW